MKKYLFLTLGLWMAAATAWGDEVDPIGDDHWKSLVLTIRQLDRRTLPDAPVYVDSDAYSTSPRPMISLQFGGKYFAIETSKVSVGQDKVMEKITIPRAAYGGYKVTYEGPGSMRFTLLLGEVTEKTKNLLIELKRIDVNHMLVTREDGTTYTADIGTASVDFYNSYTHENEMRFDTGFGIDVPTGFKYEINVTAPTEDGRDSYKSVLDFTKK
jgi:hypothetical protein